MGTQQCKSCSHPQVRVIDELLMGGKSVRGTARAFGLSLPSVRRHRDAHLPGIVAERQAATPPGSVPDVIAGRITDLDSATAEGLIRQLIQSLDATPTAGMGTAALMSLAREKRLAAAELSKVARPAGSDHPDLATSPEWVELREAFIAFLNEEDPSGGLVRRLRDRIRRWFGD